MIDKYFIGMAITYIFLFATVYLGSSYQMDFLNEYSGIGVSLFCLLEITRAMKTFTSTFWLQLAKRFNAFGIIGGINILGYAIFFAGIKVLYFIYKEKTVIVPSLFYVASIFFLSGVFTLTDTINYMYIVNNNYNRGLYSKIKLFSVFGHLLGHGSAMVHLFIRNKMGNQGKGDTRFKEESLIIAILTPVYGIISLLCFIFLTPPVAKVKTNITNEITNETGKKKSQTSNMKSLFTLPLVLLFITLTIQGIHRKCMSSFQTHLLKLQGITSIDIRLMLIVKLLPELFSYYIANSISNIIGPIRALSIAIFFASLRVFIYGVVDISKVKFISPINFCICIELLKGLWSGFYGALIAPICDAVFGIENSSVRFALLDGAYNGLGVALAAIIQYYARSNYKSDAAIGFIINCFFYTGLIGFSGILLLEIVHFIHNKTEEKSE